ncbi:MAG: copper resistance protein B [Oleiphilaceae bacterium]|nr:copper resistance protein B [Oleiphilaceae bacterium]
MSHRRQAVSALIIGFSLAGTPVALAEVTAKETQLAKKFWGISIGQLEYRYSDSDAKLGVFEGAAFYGTDELKGVWLFEGEWENEHSAWETLENQFVAQKPIAEFFDAKAGIRIDTPEGSDRVFGVLGVTGLAPQWIELDSNLFFSDEGDVSADLELEYELLLTNRLIMHASFEVDVAFSEDKEIGIGSGLNATETGLRLSYDVIDRLFSPYIGIVHERKYGDTADLAETSEGGTEDWFAVAGVKILF